MKDKVTFLSKLLLNEILDSLRMEHLSYETTLVWWNNLYDGKRR